MTGWRRAVAGLALVLAASSLAPASTAVAEPGAPVPSRVLFTFQGDEVIESSGLVDRGRTVYTNNDSGDGPVVYGVDSRTGRVVSRTTYADDATDVEAIAPGADGTIWAGDIGDNREDRDGVEVYRLTPRDGDHPGTRYPLAYPDGSHNAEALLVQPGTQRVFVVSKSFFGGTVYAAPRHLRANHTNRLRAFARVDGLITDGTFFPDGRHVLLRTYGTASVYTFPGFGLVGTVRLPSQPQGEGISVGPGGRVLVSSEGVHAAVLRVTLPSRLTSPRAAATATPRPTPSPGSSAQRQPSAAPRSAADWAGIAAVLAGLVGVAYLVLRAAPRRGRRRP